MDADERRRGQKRVAAGVVNQSKPPISNRTGQSHVVSTFDNKSLDQNLTRPNVDRSPNGSSGRADIVCQNNDTDRTDDRQDTDNRLREITLSSS